MDHHAFHQACHISVVGSKVPNISFEACFVENLLKIIFILRFIFDVSEKILLKLQILDVNYDFRAVNHFNDFDLILDFSFFIFKFTCLKISELVLARS